jgi:hypothetical protein
VTAAADRAAHANGLDALGMIPARRLMLDDLVVRFPLAPGDKPLVTVGQVIEPGTPLVERVRDPRVEEVAGTAVGEPARSGDRWSGDLSAAGLRRRTPTTDGELLAPQPGSGDRWWVVTADHRDEVVSPVGGEVVEIAHGVGIRLRVRGRAIPAMLMTGSPSHGRLDLATDPTGELRPGGIDVGRAGAVLVVGARIDAEALTRARAMGVRGIVVASLAGKDLRDVLASERRQRAALHGAPPFAILVMEGAIRRSLPSPMVALFEALAGREVAVVGDPPALVFDAPDVVMPDLVADLVRVRHGPLAGREGRLEGLAGRRRFEAGTQLETAWVRFDETAPVALPLGDLERFS